MCLSVMIPPGYGEGTNNGNRDETDCEEKVTETDCSKERLGNKIKTNFFEDQDNPDNNDYKKHKNPLERARKLGFSYYFPERL